MNARIVLFVSIALLVGVGGGFGLGQALAPVAQTARGPVTDNGDGGLEEPKRSRPANDRREDSAPVRPDKPRKDDPAPSAEPAPTPASGARIEVPLGTGVVTGSFVDDVGAAVAGIVAQLHLDTAELRPKQPRQEDFGEDVEAYFKAMLVYHEQNTRLQLDATMRAISDAAGKFRFERVPDGNARLYVKPVAHLIDPGQATLSKTAKPGDNFDIKLIRALPVRVRIEAPIGDKPRNTWLRWSPKAENGAAGGQAAEPEKEITVYLIRGSYTLRASFEGASGGSAELELGDTPPAEVIVLSSKPTRGITGTVSCAGAKPQYYAIQVVQVLPDLTDEELFSGRQGIASAQANLDTKTGKFQWEHPLDGEYAVGLRVANKLTQVQKVWLGGTVREMEFVLPQPDAPRLKVTVQAPASDQPRSPNIGVVEIPGNRGMGQEIWIVSETEYLLFFTGYTSSKPLPQRARLNVSLQGLGQVSREFMPGTENDITITFAEPADLNITVDGAPLGLRQVQVNLTDVEGTRSMRQFTVYRNQDGTWRRENSTLQPGSYKATVNGEWGNGPEYDSQSLTLVSGANSLRIKIGELHTLKLDGSGLKLRNNAQVEQKSTGRKWDINFDNNSIALLTLLPTGQYRLHFRDPANQREMAGFDFTAPSSGSVAVTR